MKEAPALDAYANVHMARAFTGDSIPRIAGPRVRLRNLSPRPRHGLQPTGGSSAVRGTGVYGMTIAGAAARRCSSPPRPNGSACAPAECKASTRASCTRIWEERNVRRTGRIRGEASVPSRPALKDPGYLLHPAHGAPAPRHPHQGRRQRHLRHRFQHARACCRGRGDGAGQPAASSVGRQPVPRKRCRA